MDELTSLLHHEPGTDHTSSSFGRVNSLLSINDNAFAAPVFGTLGPARVDAKDIDLNEVFAGALCHILVLRP